MQQRIDQHQNDIFRFSGSRIEGAWSKWSTGVSAHSVHRSLFADHARAAEQCRYINEHVEDFSENIQETLQSSHLSDNFPYSGKIRQYLITLRYLNFRYNIPFSWFGIEDSEQQFGTGVLLYLFHIDARIIEWKL